MDIVSEVFSTLRLKSDIYFKADLRGEFAVEIPRDRKLIRFHLVSSGACWVKTRAMDQPVLLPQGGLAVIPNGRQQVLSSSPNGKPVPLDLILRENPVTGSLLRHQGRGPGRVQLLCGFCGFDEMAIHPVLEHLPDIIILTPDDLKAEPRMAASLRLMALESDLDDQGMRGILIRLLEITLIQVVRKMPEQNPENPGYISALRDGGLSRALLAVHRSPERNWTVAGLAQESGMSRAGFAERFSSLVGMTPMAYVTNWRLMKARQLLLNTDLGMAEIAAQCGYASLPSFSRRFKAAFGLGPGGFRKRG